MPTPNDACREICKRFLADFTELGRDRIAFDNAEFDEPADGEWVRLVVRHHSRLQDTLGRPDNRRFRSSGSVLAQVFTEAGSRMREADRIAKAIEDIFDSASFSGLDFQASVSRESGPDGKWNMVIVEIPFEYDEIK